MFVMFSGMFIMALLGYDGSQSSGESIVQTQTTPLTSGDAGTLDSSVPPVLAEMFQLAGSTVGTPAALLAGISYQECNQLWGIAKSDPELVKRWITNNEDVDRRGCGYNNGVNVWGPMQFLYSTFGVAKGADPRNHPPLRSGSYGDVAGRTYTGHVPASMLNIKDSVFAAALKLQNDSKVKKKTGGSKPRPQDWEATHVKEAARRYFGACVGRVGSKTVYYCDDILRRWQQYQ